MTRIGTGLASALAFGMLAGSAIGASAQADSGATGAPDAEFAAPVEVTGAMGSGRCSHTREEGDEATLPGTDDQYTCSSVWQFDDTRLSGRVTLTNENVWLVGNGLESAGTLSTFCDEDPECEAPGLETVHSAVSVENDGGTWRQRPTVRLLYAGGTETEMAVIILDGEGSYEGLVAVLEATGHEDDAAYYGFILDARQVKPAPWNASSE